MKIAKLFVNGRSQAVRLPKEFRFTDSEVYIKKIGQMVVLMPKMEKWEQFFAGLEEFSDDYLDERNQPQQQKRKSL